MLKFNKLQPTQYVVLGFFLVILTGSILLVLPFMHMKGAHVSYIDALFTATSAVSVTGLIAIDTAEHFNVLGRIIIALLIQIGGLGVTSVGAAFILMMHKKFGLHHRLLLMEGMNFKSLSGVVRLVKYVLKFTLIVELIGMMLSFIVFSRDYPFWSALGISAFHSVAAFNNAGFDILGGGQNLIPYRDSILLNLTTAGLIIIAGLGYVTTVEIYVKRNFKKLSMNTKIVVIITVTLLIVGTILLKITEGFSWMDAFFHSVSARTAGFCTVPIGSFTHAGLLVLSVLMFIGASPGSTGGGIKTTTFFTIIRSIRGIATNTPVTAFKRRIPADSIIKAFSIFTLAIMVITTSTLLILMAEPKLTFIEVFVEVVSAAGTVGLSAGITSVLSIFSNLVLCLTMFIGRLGPLSIACIWAYQKAAPKFNYPEEQITIG